VRAAGRARDARGRAGTYHCLLLTTPCYVRPTYCLLPTYCLILLPYCSLLTCCLLLEQGKHHKGERGGGGGGGHSSFGSVGAKFVKSLKELMAELGSADAHFVRCVKPNAELVPLKLHGEDVVNQLRMSGMLDAVKLIQAGYPTRIPCEARTLTLTLTLTRRATPRASRTRPSTRATRASSHRRYDLSRPPSSPKYSPACATCGRTRTS
jgi:hypothetical protein